VPSFGAATKITSGARKNERWARLGTRFGVAPN
jgi:hypothetical protein